MLLAHSLNQQCNKTLLGLCIACEHQGIARLVLRTKKIEHSKHQRMWYRTTGRVVKYVVQSNTAGIAINSAC